MKKTTNKYFCDCCLKEITTARMKKQDRFEKIWRWILNEKLKDNYFFGTRELDICYNCKRGLEKCVENLRKESDTQTTP